MDLLFFWHGTGRSDACAAGDRARLMRRLAVFIDSAQTWVRQYRLIPSPAGVASHHSTDALKPAELEFLSNAGRRLVVMRSAFDQLK